MPCLLLTFLNDRNKIFLITVLYSSPSHPRGNRDGEFGVFLSTSIELLKALLFFLIFFLWEPSFLQMIYAIKQTRRLPQPCPTYSQLVVIACHMGYKPCSLLIHSQTVFILNFAFFGMAETIIINVCLFFLVFFNTLNQKSGNFQEYGKFWSGL